MALNSNEQLRIGNLIYQVFIARRYHEGSEIMITPFRIMDMYYQNNFCKVVLQTEIPNSNIQGIKTLKLNDPDSLYFYYSLEEAEVSRRTFRIPNAWGYAPGYDPSLEPKYSREFDTCDKIICIASEKKTPKEKQREYIQENIGCVPTKGFEVGTGKKRVCGYIKRCPKRRYKSRLEELLDE